MASMIKKLRCDQLNQVYTSWCVAKDTGLLGVGDGVGRGVAVGLEAVEGDLQGVAERVVIQTAAQSPANTMIYTNMGGEAGLSFMLTSPPPRAEINRPCHNDDIIHPYGPYLQLVGKNT